MTDLVVAMSLTLADTASGPLKAVTEGLAQLKATGNGLAGVLEKIAVGITNIEKAASSAKSVGGLTASLDALLPTLAKVRAEGAGTASTLGSIGSRASAGVRGTYALEQSMAALLGTLSRSAEKLTATAAGLGMIGTEARAAGAGVAAGTRAMDGALVSTNTQATGLSSTLKGLAALWGAVKIEKGISASISEAGEFQQATKGVEALNLGPQATAEIVGKAWDDSKALKYVSALDAIKVRMNLIAGLAEPMNQKVLDTIARPVMQLVNNLKFLGDSTEEGALGKNIMGIFETRGQTADPAAMQRTMDLIQKASVVTHGNITVRDLDTFLRGVGAGGQNISDDGLSRLIELMNQEKIAGGSQGGGGGASRLSTQVKLLQAYATGKAMNKQGAQMLIESDILTPGAINEDGSAVLSRNIKPGGVQNARLAVSDPIKWIEQNAGKIIAYTRRHEKDFYEKGADLNDPATIDAAVQKFLVSLGFTVTATKLLSSATNPRTQARIENGVGMQRQAMTSDQFADSIKDTYQQNVVKFDKALENLKITIGTTILPAITSIMEKFGQFTALLASFAQDHPTITHLLVLAAGILGVKLAISGVASVFGIVGKLSSVLLEMGGASTKGMAAAAEGVATGGLAIGGRLSALATTVGSVMTRIGGFFMRAIPFVGWLLVAWDVAQLVGNLEVGGKKISDWATDLGAKISNAFKNAWIRTREFFGFLTADAVKAMRDANDSELFNSTGGSANRAYAPLTAAQLAAKNKAVFSGAEHQTPEEIRAQQLADADANAKGGPKVASQAAGRFAHYDKALEDAKEADRLLEDEQKRHQQAQDALFKADRISIDAYYDDKLKTITSSILAEIAALEKEKAAYAKEGDKAGVSRTESSITIKARDLMEAPDKVGLEREQAKIKLAKEAAEVERDLMKSAGERHAAEMQRIQDELAAKLKVLVLNKEITQEQANAMLARSKAASDYTEQYKQIAVVQEAYGEKAAAIDDAERNGTLSQSGAAAQKLDLMKQESVELDTLIAKLRALAVASGNDSAVLQLDKMSTKNRSTQGQFSPETVQMLNATRSGFEQMFSSVLNGSMSAGKAIEQFAQSLKKSFLDIISKKLGDALFDSLFGGGSGGKSGGGGLFGLIGGLFGGGGSGGAMGTASMAGGTGFGDFNATGDLAHLAVGTDYVPRDMLAMIHKGERVMPARDNAAFSAAAAMRGNSGPTSMQLSIHPDAAHMMLRDWFEGEMARTMANR